MFFKLIKHAWLKDLRAPGFYKNLTVNILMGFMGLYFGAIFLFLGFKLGEILESAHPTLDPMQLFNGAMLYIMLGGLALRFFMQQLNTVSLPSYQVLPVKRRSLINFLLLKPLFSVTNYFLLLVVIPFAFMLDKYNYDEITAFRLVLTFTALIWFNSLMTSFLKRQFSSGFLSIVAVLVVLGGIAALEFFQIFSLFTISMTVFNYIALNWIGLLIPVAAIGVAYLLNRWYFSSNYYVESFSKQSNNGLGAKADLSFLNRFGLIGEIIAMELKLILRHKRTKSILYMSGFFLFYGLLFYTNPMYADSPGMLFFVAVFITGLLMLMYGQWVISWDSSHFDGLMTKNISIHSYLNANYYMLIAFNGLCFILTTPYFFFGTHILYNHVAAFIFNCGVNSYLLLFTASFHTKRIDLSKSSAMNYQGTTFKSFLVIMPIMFLPMILVSVITMFASINVALISLSTMGILGIIFKKQMLQLCVDQFNRRKYKLAEGFRQSE